MSQKKLLNKISFKFLSNNACIIFHLTCKIIWKSIRIQGKQRYKKGENMMERMNYINFHFVCKPFLLFLLSTDTL